MKTAQDQQATRRGKSRLDRMIARLSTQKIFLEWAAREVAGLEGPVIELGLGKGRTYDHLRRILPARDILVFDRLLHAPPDCVPPEADFYLGEFAQTWERARERVGEGAALAHADIGSNDPEKDARRTAELAPLLDRLMRPGGLVLTDRKMEIDRWQPVNVPRAAADGWVYYAYRVAGD